MKHLEWLESLAPEAQAALEEWADLGPPTAECQKHYTVGDVATALRLTPITIRQYVREGRIFARKLGRKWLVPEDAVARFMYNASHSMPADPDVPMGVLFIWSDQQTNALADYKVLSARELEDYAIHGMNGTIADIPRLERYRYELSSVIECEAFLEEVGLLDYPVREMSKLANRQFALAGSQLHAMNELAAKEWHKLPLSIVRHEYKVMFGKEPDVNDLRLLRMALLMMTMTHASEERVDEVIRWMTFGELAEGMGRPTE